MSGPSGDSAKSGHEHSEDLRGFIYDSEEGSVECKLCGTRAFSHKPESLVLWQAAHEQCCRWRSNELRSA